jgi:hypothetical protein
MALKAQSGLVPLFERNPGFVAYYVVDGGDGHLVSVSVFESAEAAHNSNEEAAAWAEDNVSQFLPDPPQVTHGQVLVSEKR